MTSDQWQALKAHLKERSRRYPWDMTEVSIGELRELVGCFKDALAMGETELCDEPPEARG